MSKHTAGEWVVHRGEICYRSTEDDQSYGMLYPVDLSDEANAKLISAAPCLLESLIKRVEDGESAAFEDWLTSSKPSGDAENVHRQWLRSSNYSDFRLEWYQELEAIAKATGGE